MARIFNLISHDIKRLSYLVRYIKVVEVNPCVRNYFVNPSFHQNYGINY